MSTELVFLVEEAPEGGYTARALSQAIFTDGDSMKKISPRSFVSTTYVTTSSRYDAKAPAGPIGASTREDTLQIRL